MTIAARRHALLLIREKIGSIWITSYTFSSGLYQYMNVNQVLSKAKII